MKNHIKAILAVIFAFIALTFMLYDRSVQAQPKTGQRIVLVESITINGTHLIIVSIDKKEYLINHNGGIIKIE